MLNRVKVAQELERVSQKLFPDFSQEFDGVRAVWQQIANDPLFVHHLQGVSTSCLIPTWSGRLQDQYAVNLHVPRYCVLGMDGSQIYPDRHEGASCFLINIGAVHLHYGVGNRAVEFASEPTVFAGDDGEEVAKGENPQELVNCLRQELELQVGIEHARAMQALCTNGEPSLFLFDGSLIFWHLEAKNPEVKQRFLARYLDSLHTLSQEKVLCAGYISLTKSKELVNLMHVALTELVAELKLEQLVQSVSFAVLDRMVDANIVRFFLEPYCRTILFKNHSNISKSYPPHLHPYFFYLHVGHEIARIEIPAWIAESEPLVDLVASMIIDQCKKGDGYPVALAEAHEQAVVKGPDREFFYHLVRRVGIEYQQQATYSQKIRNKRGMRI